MLAGVRKQWLSVNLKDNRLERRALEIGYRITLRPKACLARQMQDKEQLKATYRFLDNPLVSQCGLEPAALASHAPCGGPSPVGAANARRQRAGLCCIRMAHERRLINRPDGYTTRWVMEDYHQCLKTGCAIERRDF
jgi:hypothetical protein